MAIPGYQDIMYPLLTLLQDGKEHTLQEARDNLSRFFGLTDEEKNEMLPSGKQKTFYNRLGWTRTYLKNAGLLRIVRKGVFVITDQGQNVLNDPTVKNLNNAYLMRYEEFRKFKTRGSKGVENLIEVTEETTPIEEIERNYKLLKEASKNDLLEKVKSSSPSFFERLVVDLLVAMGYGGSIHDAGQAIGRSGDEGIDGIIKEDILGLDMIYLQA